MKELPTAILNGKLKADGDSDDGKRAFVVARPFIHQKAMTPNSLFPPGVKRSDIDDPVDCPECGWPMQSGVCDECKADAQMAIARDEV